MEYIDGEAYASTKYMSECLGISERRVRQLADEGVFSPVRKGSAFRYDIAQTVQAYLRSLRERKKEITDSEKSLEKQKLAAEASIKESKAEQEKIALSELQGEMHRAEDVEQMTGQLVHAVRTNLIALPGRLAVDVAAAQNAEEASIIIRDEVNSILNELAGFRYDPDGYAELVRERKGWSNDSGDEEAQ